MLNPDSNDKNFDLWLAQGLKKPFSPDPAFVYRLFDRLDEQTARQLLHRTAMQMKILAGVMVVFVVAGIVAMVYPPVNTAVFSFLQDLLEGLIGLIVQPTLIGMMAPVAVLVLTGLVLWNLIEMVSLE
jgi:hypothetical protein